MGAEVFSHLTHGVNVQEAFQRAVEEAQYDYGHAGYTGTIAEKTDYIMVTDKAITLADAEALGEKLIEDQDPRIDDKWGPAGVIEIENNGGFYFFGWASS